MENCVKGIGVSIIIVNWNGENYLKDCLGSLLAQTYAQREIIFVDNGSGDDSVRFVVEQFSTVKVVELEDNAGFTGGNLAGFDATGGDFIAVVNNDTRSDEQWLQNLLQPMIEEQSVGICAGKICFDAGRRIDSAGGQLSTAGVGFNRGLGSDSALFDESGFVFGGCGAAVLYRRQMLEEIGFLDEDFFLYDEDTDLSFRAQLAGWKCVYVPDAIVYHKGNATAGRLSDTHVYYHTRNLEFVWIKNMPLGLMLRFAHHKVLQEIGSFCYLCLRHGKWAPYFKAKVDALRMLPRMLQKRRVIQARKRVSNAYLRSLMTSMFTWSFVGQKIRQFIHG